jgi:DNA (cytosine-5)-methyltransferase 1
MKSHRGRRKHTPHAADRRTVVSVFSGGGGLDLGLELAGFRTAVAIEIDNWAAWTLRENQAAKHPLPNGRSYLAGTTILEEDVRRISGNRILREVAVEAGEIAVLAGGPPCVSFSIAGAREGLASETGMLFESYARLLRVLKPRAFVFENVKGLLSAAGPDGEPGGAWPIIRDRLSDAGYRISWELLDAAAFGVPQHRERVIVVGLRGRRGDRFEFPSATHGVDLGEDCAFVDVRHALAGLSPAAAPGEEATIANHVSRKHSADVRASFEATQQGRRNDRFKRDRLRWDKPSKVIRAQGKRKKDSTARHSSHQAIHPDEPRQLTVRECARIQTFPDWYRFPATHCNGYRVVGDAVPPLLAEAIGVSLLGQLPAAELRHPTPRLSRDGEGGMQPRNGGRLRASPA